MANQVVVSQLLELVSDKLADLIEKKFGVASRVDNEMKKLSKTLSRIKYFVVDAEEKQVTDFTIRDWLRDLKDAACNAEDALEECEYQGLLQVAPETSHNNNFVEKLSDSLKVLDDSANEYREFDLRKGVVEKSNKISETGSLLTEPVYGREEDKRILVRRLVSRPSQHCHPSSGEGSSTNEVTNSLGHISVCPIQGQGGIGKTTLAKLAYNDERVARHFEVRAWTCVSDDFDVNRIIRGIISSTGTACEHKELDPLQRELQRILRGKRFLLVLDDIWENCQNKWNEVMGTLACGAKGSCVIVTTRLDMVASITGTIPSLRLDPLSENDCCALFKQHAFGLGENRPDLMEIGNEIVKKCKGVPLAAKALGASLRFKREPRQWLHVKNSEIWQLSENGILPALRLSYNHLSPQLRQCFAYCAIYKKDHKIDKKELIYLWIANGFVQSRGSMMRLEDVGNEIFEALLWRSFFQDITKGEDGDITTCKMHNLVHDLACDVAGKECSIVGGGSTKTIDRKTRHLSLFPSSTPYFSFELLPKYPPSLRSILMREQANHWLFKDSQIIFSHLIGLRALDLSGPWSWQGTSTTVLPDNIGDMKHLRYLNLSYSPITSLPESICKLINLEILNLKGCENLDTLPTGMSEMSKLRHLDNSDCISLNKMPIGIGKLTCLQTLSSFVVGWDSGSGGIKELRGLNNVEGALEIGELDNVRNPMDAKAANLSQKENLCSLSLLWLVFDGASDCWDRDSATATATATEVMKGLQPPPNLRRFVVWGYNGVSFPSLLLPKLVKMELSDCLLLKFIDEGGDALAAGGFMSLEELHLNNMPELEGWSSLPSSSSSQTSGGEGDQQAAAEVIPKRRILTRATPVTIQLQSSLPSSSHQQAVEEAAQAEAAKLLFPCLKKLTLYRCHKLTSIPLPSSVESVTLKWRHNHSILGQLKNLPRLSHLEIGKFYGLECFPQDMLLNLTALQNLEIKYFGVEALPDGLMNLSCLRSLHIHGCYCLKQLPKLNKSCLVDLHIGYCPKLEFNMEEDFQNLVAFQRLTLESLPMLAHFPEGIKQAVMLKHLSIMDCSEEVMDLPDWIGTLTSLEYFSIEGCKNRKVLPEGMQHLTALRKLRIWGCDAELEIRCERDTGADWSKIAHVPNIIISSSSLTCRF